MFNPLISLKPRNQLIWDNTTDKLVESQRIRACLRWLTDTLLNPICLSNAAIRKLSGTVATAEHI